ncbi:MMPL family protein [Aeromicrobium marinum DSM 15272]|uniref:MMPL family protein n=1 Tax=Aeromicrobium marinum DSM 15272 TaxID=585531 RepID=E2S981_9ACTN|nr:MMPL family transporter [Aeromicrobium marinum]EFQ83805.1 MMPL family protein [Aeromicrobium marinum DSM 15272]
MESFDGGTKSSSRSTEPVLRRRGAWLLAALFVVASGAALGSGLTPQEVPGGPGGLPDSAESTEVARIVATLPTEGSAPAVVVVSRGDAGLEPADRPVLDDLATSLGEALGTEAVASTSPDGSVGLVVVPTTDAPAEEQVNELRDVVAAELPDGLSAQVTGAPAFATDLSEVFAGADVRLLVATATIVALLLLITYRSPWLWLVPLVVVAVGDRVATIVVAGATRLFDYDVDGSTVGITSVLVFGAGTNYALLLIARYREELRRHDDRHVAMGAAWRSTAPAVLASGGTVVLALLMLSFADTPSTRALGYSASLGIGVAMLYGLVFLPAALLLFGRRLFWPFVPRQGQDDPALTGVWARIGRRVVRRPAAFMAGALAVIAVLAVGATGVDVGLTQNEQFREVPEAVVGQQRLAEAFPAGAAEPTTVLTSPDRVDEVLRTVADVDGVAEVRPGRSDDRWATLDVVLDAEQGSVRAFDTVEGLRAALGADDLVGGPDAQDLDSAAAASSDRLVIFPLVILVVVGVLLVLLRSVVAALVLVTTVAATYVAALGAGWWVSDLLFGFPALDLTVPLFAFVFLVALGVDYNIFLATRAREEAARQPVAGAMTSALAVTGGVITSAGVLLAAVFAVLGVLPLITLTQIGIIVGIGVLLDTLLVRTLLVPSLATLIGERFWWPRHPGVSDSWTP